MKRWLQPWLVVGLVALVYMIVVVASSGENPLVLATVGTRFAEGDPNGSESYDGQFSYYFERHHRTGWTYCDVPAYRYRSILYPAVGRCLACGQE